MRTLYGLKQSPWTEKARWALDHHAVEYRYREHVPVLGEVGLRWRARPYAGKPSVPLLVDGSAAVMTSLAIARHVDATGRGDRLFPDEKIEDVTTWADLSDRIICVGRIKVLRDLKTNVAAQREALPPFIPAGLGRVFAPMATSAAWFLGSKYGVPHDLEAHVERELRPALDRARRALEGRRYLLGAFTFADIAIAASLQTLRPWHGSRVGPATRHLWTQESLASEYEDLLEWRDAVYAERRNLN